MSKPSYVELELQLWRTQYSLAQAVIANAAMNMEKLTTLIAQRENEMKEGSCRVQE